MAPHDDAKVSHSPSKDEHAKTVVFWKNLHRKEGDNPVAIAKKLKVSYNNLSPEPT